MRSFLTPTLLSAALGCALFACAGQSDGGGDDRLVSKPSGLLSAGNTAPDVTLTAMDDSTLELSSLRGKTVLLNFWFHN